MWDKISVRFLLLYLPWMILWSPFLGHRSDGTGGSYSTRYIWFLVATAAGPAAVALILALATKLSRLTLFKVQLSILLFIISLCAGEFYLSITHDDAFAELRAWGQRKAWMTGFQSQENHSWHAAYAEYSTDRYGFRRNTIVPDWDDGDSELVFVVGGSSAFGYGLNDRETWAEHLQQGLNEHGPGPAVSVVNAGNNAFNSLQVLMRFYNDVLPHSPAVVVFYENRNDYSGRILSTEDILFSGTMHDYVVRIKRDKSLYERTLLFYFAEKAVNSWFGSSAHIDRGVQDASPIVERNPED